MYCILSRALSLFLSIEYGGPCDVDAVAGDLGLRARSLALSLSLSLDLALSLSLSPSLSVSRLWKTMTQ